MNEQDPQPLLTVDDVAHQLRMSVATIYKRRSLGLSLPRAIKVGSLVRWTQESVDEFVEANTESELVG